MSEFVEDRSVLSRVVSRPDRSLRYGDTPDQIADFRFGGETARQRPLILLIHGGFWRPQFDRSHTNPLSEAIAAAGWSIVTPEYSRVPGSPDLMVADVKRAIAALPDLVRGECNGELILIGHSAGGHLALWAAAALSAAAIRGVIALAPVADLQWAHAHALGDNAVQAFLGTTPEQRADLDPSQLPSPRSQISIIHGVEDKIVPLEISKVYAAAHSQVQLFAETQCGHFNLIDPQSTVWSRLRAALLSL